MEKKLNGLIEQISKKLQDVDTLNDLNLLRAEYLGKKSVFNDLMQELKDVPKEDKPKFGQMINEAKNQIASMIENAKSSIEKKMIEARLKAETIDVTLPGKKTNIGSKHLISQVIEEVSSAWDIQ